MGDLKINVEIRENKKGRGIYSLIDLLRGEMILYFEKNYVNYSTNMTLRIDENRFQMTKNPDAPDNFINHSCDPNCYIGWRDLSLRALKPIKTGEELTYNYFTSDWDNEDPFECRCGSKNCKRIINGFKNLDLCEMIELFDLLSPFLKKKFYEIYSGKNKN